VEDASGTGVLVIVEVGITVATKQMLRVEPVHIATTGVEEMAFCRNFSTALVIKIV